MLTLITHNVSVYAMFRYINILTS